MQYNLRLEQKQLEHDKSALLTRAEKLNERAENLHNEETYLSEVSARLDKRKANIDAEVKKSVASIIKDAFQDLFQKFKDTFLKHFKGKHQEEVLEVIKEMSIDEQTADRLFRYGFYDAERHTVGEIMERALEEDIKDVLHESGASYRQIKMADIEVIKQSIGSGASLEDVVNNIATDVSKRIVSTRTR